MRLVIFIFCLASLIFISRCFTIPAERSESVAITADVDVSDAPVKNTNSGTPIPVPTIARTVFHQTATKLPVASRFAVGPSQDAFQSKMPPPSNDFRQPTPSVQLPSSTFSGNRSATAPGFQPTQTFVSSHPSIAMPSNAKNVRTLIRADYELPKDAAAILEKLFLLDPASVVETKIIESENEAIIILQVTTDAESQQAIGNFFSPLYPTDKIAMLKRETEEDSDDEAEDDVESEKVSVGVKETCEFHGTQN